MLPHHDHSTTPSIRCMFFHDEHGCGSNAGIAELVADLSDPRICPLRHHPPLPAAAADPTTSAAPARKQPRHPPSPAAVVDLAAAVDPAAAMDPAAAVPDGIISEFLWISSPGTPSIPWFYRLSAVLSTCRGRTWAEAVVWGGRDDGMRQVGDGAGVEGCMQLQEVEGWEMNQGMLGLCVSESVRRESMAEAEHRGGEACNLADRRDLLRHIGDIGYMGVVVKFPAAELCLLFRPPAQKGLIIGSERDEML